MAKGDIISRLRLESGEFDSKIKRAGQELMAYSEHCRKTGLEMGYANKDAKEFAKSLGTMQTTATTARGKISELSDAFVNLKVMYKNMTDAEKQGQFGRNLAASLEQLKQRIGEAKGQLADVQKELSGSKFGEFGGIIDGIGKKMGVTGNLTELLTSKTAMLTAGMGAAVAVIGKATDEWAKYNAELARQDQVTQVTTGLKGPQADKMTDQARAIQDTYGADFREVINAANTLMTQFGQSGEQAMRLISDGMQGMIQGDAPKLLSMIQQYAPSFRDAGISASQLVAIIHNSEGGIFTDANMNAIVMGIKNIRLMTNATSEALKQLGIDGQEMTRKLNDGSMTIFDALKQVATAIDGTASGSQAAGNVMQQVFGRQGAMAGTKLGEAIATLNLNLEETKRQTGEVGNSFRELQSANERLNTAIRDCFEYDGWDAMARGIKANLITALAGVIEKLGDIKRALFGINGNDFYNQQNGGNNGQPTKVDRQVSMLGNGNSQRSRDTYQRQMQAYDQYIVPRENAVKAWDSWRKGDRSEAVRDGIEWAKKRFGETDKQLRAELDGAKKMRDEYDRRAQALFKESATPSVQPLSLTPPTTPKNPSRSTIDTEKELTIQQQITALEKEAVNASAERRAEIAKHVQALDEELARQKEITDEIHGRSQKRKVDIKFDNIATNGLMGLPRTIDDQLKRTDTLKKKVVLEMQTEAVKVDEQTLQTLMRTSIEHGINELDFQFGALGEKIAKGIDIPDDTWESLLERINSQLTDGIEPINIDFNTGKLKEKEEKSSPDKALEKTSKAISGLNSIMGGIEKIGIPIPDELRQVVGVFEGVMSVIQGVQTIISLTQTPAMIANTTALTALTAAMWANTATSWFPLARGGVVHAASGTVAGNTFSGDQIPAMLNAGETVLNRAQTAALASELQDNNGGSRGLHIVGRIKGEDIILSANRTFKRRGEGEIVTW